MNKLCPSCKKDKDVSNFGVRYKGIYRSYCRECEKQKKRVYDAKNRLKIRLRAKKHYLNNAEKEKARAKKYRVDNKEKLRKYYRSNGQKRLARQKERIRNDPKFRLRRSISACIRERLRSRLIDKKYRGTFSFIPYTIDELMRWLESRFKPGMTWGNYGEWHIDHIRPDSSFTYSSVEDEEFKKCWALDNLQPLWAVDNMVKSNKIYE